MPNGKHIFKTASDMDIEKMCAYLSSKYALPHWKCVMSCCAQYPSIDIPSPELDQHNSDVSPPIIFHVYHPISWCTVHSRLPFNEKKQCQLCDPSADSIVTEKLYTRNILSWWKHQLWDFTNNYKYQPCRNLHKTFHTYIFLKYINVEIRAKRHSKAVQFTTMCCSIEIIQNL